MKDCSIQLTDRPGDLARIAEALARRGVNIKGLAAVSIGRQALAHIIPDDIEPRTICVMSFSRRG